MKNKKRIGFPLVMLGALVLTSCGGSGYRTFPVTGPYMTGKTAKGVYNAYLGSAPTTLNPTLSQNGENVSHLANLVSTLVMNDNYGILRKELATKVTHNDDYTQFVFTIRDNVPWVQYDGTIYKYQDKEQYVTATDFVKTASIILDYNNSSEIYYMYTLFINNAWEYYLYTMMQKFIVEGKKGYAELKNNKPAQANKLNELIKEYSGEEPKEKVTADMLDTIASFSRVGVKANGNTLTYTLKSPAQFFPTMLTYTPYTPTNTYFYKANAKTYGTKKEKMLYCGPFRLTDFSSTQVVYTKNEKFYNADKVHLDTVNYKVVDATTSYKDMREAFDRKDVDGFSLNQQDETGWKKYITGEDGKGTIQNPASDQVNSRELDDIDYTYHFNLDVNRSTEKASWVNATYWDEKLKDKFPTDADKVKCIENTNAALKIKEVRKLILDGISFEVHNKQFTTDDPNQYQMNTFTPRGYVYDEYAKDYIEYYYETYATKRGLKDSTEAKSLVKPQQYSGVEYVEPSTATAEWLTKYPWLNLKTMRDNAISAAQQYRDDNGNALSFPIIVDYMGTGGISPETAANENELVTSWNERANCCTINSSHVTKDLPLCKGSPLGDGHYPYFEMVQDKITNSTTWSSAANNGYYTLGTWGWIGDYADPLTYLHCYVTNGEMSKMSGNTAEFPSYSLDESGILQKSDNHMLYDYNNIVNAASKITTSNHERYQKFAEAEYMLLNDLYIMKPCYMTSQGWVASVSRALGYENPSAHYGLADHLLTGIWVLDKEVPTGKERQECRDKQNTLKAEELAKYGGNTINAIYED